MYLLQNYLPADKKFSLSWFVCLSLCLYVYLSIIIVMKVTISQLQMSQRHCRTRKPCYRKDDRAMRPIYGCHDKFRESSQTPPATFPEICKGLLFRSTLRMRIQNLKFVALSVPEIIGATQKIWAVPVYAHVPVSSKFLIGFCSYGPSEYICQI